MSFNYHSIVTLAAMLLITAISVLLHYQVCRTLSRTRKQHPKGHRLIGVIFVFLLAHLVEVNLFGVAYYVFANMDGYGHVTNAVNFVDYVYFSGAVYTTLGFGDLSPVGALRVFSTMESLLGLTLITWSASYAYFEMSEHWKDDAPSERRESR